MRTRIRVVLHALRPKRNPFPGLVHPVVERTKHFHGPVHVLYFGLVAWEVSKWYAVAAGTLAIIELARVLAGEESK